MGGKRDQRAHIHLVAGAITLHKGAMNDVEIFDRRRRRHGRDRAAQIEGHDRWLITRMADDLCERLDLVKKPLETALVIGLVAADVILPFLAARGIKAFACDPGYAYAKRHGGVQCDEDRLPFADASFDLVVTCGTFDSVNDLPGALILVRKVLKPDGLFLGACCGAPALPGLRALLLAAELALRGTPSAHTHPLPSLQAAADLLVRAGFQLPVVDHDVVDARYTRLDALTTDLRAMALRNVLADRAALAPTVWRQVKQHAEAGMDEQFSVIYMTAWAPATSAAPQSGPTRRPLSPVF